MKFLSGRVGRSLTENQQFKQIQGLPKSNETLGGPADFIRHTSYCVNSNEHKTKGTKHQNLMKLIFVSRTPYLTL